jgi:hypothetical protein
MPHRISHPMMRRTVNMSKSAVILETDTRSPAV